MRNIGVFAVLTAAWLSAGCAAGGARESSPASPGSGVASKSASGPADAPPPPASEPSAGSDSAEAEPAPASPSAGAGGEARRAAPEKSERPGLGTEFGENRESRISTTSFTRQSPSTPFDALKLFYNDADGARAMARRAGIADFGSGLARARQGAVTVRLLDASGRPLEGFSSGASTYVVGSAGERYTIELRNHTGVRFEAVATVDGLDVVNGRTGSLSNRGYILNPHSTVEIDGWRRSTETVAAFRFGRVSESYAGKKGSDRNVGVIGVALFEERGSSLTWTQQEIDKRHAADPFPGGFSQPPPNQPLTF